MPRHTPAPTNHRHAPYPEQTQGPGESSQPSARRVVAEASRSHPGSHAVQSIVVGTEALASRAVPSAPPVLAVPSMPTEGPINDLPAEIVARIADYSASSQLGQVNHFMRDVAGAIPAEIGEGINHLRCGIDAELQRPKGPWPKKVGPLIAGAEQLLERLRKLPRSAGSQGELAKLRVLSFEADLLCRLFATWNKGNASASEFAQRVLSAAEKLLDNADALQDGALRRQVRSGLLGAVTDCFFGSSKMDHLRSASPKMVMALLDEYFVEKTAHRINYLNDYVVRWMAEPGQSVVRTHLWNKLNSREGQGFAPGHYHADALHHVRSEMNAFALQRGLVAAEAVAPDPAH